jgi:hypothetical protein
MAYPRSEQETVLVFDAETNEWSAYSTVPKHIRKLASLTEVTVLETDEHGNPAAARATLTTKMVSMKKERVLTEEQRNAMRDRMKSTLKNAE